MVTLVIIIWILTFVILFILATLEWIKKDKEAFEVLGTMTLIAIPLGFILGPILLLVVLYQLIMSRFEE